MYYNFLHFDPYEHVEKKYEKGKKTKHIYIAHTHTHTQLHTEKKEPSSLQHHNLTLIYNLLEARFEIKRPEVFLA